jgi:hypothetical protein
VGGKASDSSQNKVDILTDSSHREEGDDEPLSVIVEKSVLARKSRIFIKLQLSRL